MLKYQVFLDGQLFATTNFEFADPPMGFVFGKIVGVQSEIDYDYLKTLVIQGKAELVSDHPEDKLISVREIVNLKVVNEKGETICEDNSLIEGMDSDCYTLTIRLGYPKYEEEFPHHVDNYGSMFD